MPFYIVEMKETTYQSVIVEASDQEEAESNAAEATCEDGFGWDGKMRTEVESAEEISEAEIQNSGAYISEKVKEKYGL